MEKARLDTFTSKKLWPHDSVKGHGASSKKVRMYSSRCDSLNSCIVDGQSRLRIQPADGRRRYSDVSLLRSFSQWMGR